MKAHLFFAAMSLAGAAGFAALPEVHPAAPQSCAVPVSMQQGRDQQTIDALQARLTEANLYLSTDNMAICKMLGEKGCNDVRAQ